MTETTNMTETTKITIKLSADDLQLYRKKGNGTAARSLSTGITRAIVEVIPMLGSAYDMDRNARAIGKVFDKHVRPRMNKHAHVGARDTEPRYVAAQTIINYVKDHLGIPRNEWTTLGDWI